MAQLSVVDNGDGMSEDDMINLGTTTSPQVTIFRQALEARIVVSAQSFIIGVWGGGKLNKAFTRKEIIFGSVVPH